MGFLDQLNVLSTPTAFAVTTSLFVSAYLFYLWLLPTPIPGIPYNEEATKGVFGDVPSMLKHLSTSKSYTDWILGHSLRHNSPIVQIFVNIFGKPWVIISDFKESQDILLRRTKEFDKPDTISDLIVAIAPAHHTVRATDDQWRAQRKLMQDLMVPTFLNGVAAPQLHTNLMDLITLWNEKIRLSKGRPFSVKSDIYNTAIEAIWAAVFGIEDTATVTREQIALLSPWESIKLPTSIDQEAVFEEAPAPPTFEAVIKLTNSLEHVAKSPMPRVQGLLMRWFQPSQRSYLKIKTKSIGAEIDKGVQRMNSSTKKENIKSGIDHMLRREKMFAEKQNRAPDYHSEIMIDELFGLLVAGHDTTSTSILWGIKHLTANPSITARLRTAIETAFPRAHSLKTVPNAHEIATTTIHYLDACIEEILRCGQTASIASRTATQDSVVLGKVIPKGTRVMFMALGHGVLIPSYPIDESLRSSTYHAADKDRIGTWDPKDITVFNPDRWLVDSGEKGEKVFDSNAGPLLAFGGGPRGCFGKRLAYLEMRMALILILWHFKLEAIPEEYASFEPEELLTHAPVQCYARLTKV